MEWHRIAGDWQHFKGNALRHWRRLTAEQVEAIAGKREQLAREVQQAYRLSSEQAELQVAAWQHAQKERHASR